MYDSKELLDRLNNAEEDLKKYKESYKNNLIYCISNTNNKEDIRNFVNEYMYISSKKVDNNVSQKRVSMRMGNAIIDSINDAEESLEKFREAYKDNLIFCMSVTSNKDDIKNFINEYINLVK